MERASEEILERYRQSLARSWKGYGDLVWPIRLATAYHLFLSEFAEEFKEDWETLTGRGYSDQSVARLFATPSRIYRIIDLLVYGLRRKRVSIDQQRGVVLRLLAMVRSLKAGSEFGDGDCNLIYDGAELQALIDAGRLSRRASLEESRLLHQFFGMMWAYSEAIYFSAHELAKEIHGPYRHDEAFPNIVVRHYAMLRPRELWSDVSLLSCREVRVFCSYRSSMRLRVDPLNNLVREGGSFVTDLIHYGVEIDGRDSSAEQLRGLIEETQVAISGIHEAIERMSWHERAVKYAEVFWLRKRPLRDALEKPWQLPEAIARNIRGGIANPRRQPRLSDAAVARLARLTI